MSATSSNTDASSAIDLDELHDDFLYFVRAHETTDLIALLPNAQLDLNHRNEQGNTALHMAAANGLADLIDVICTFRPAAPRLSADVDVRNALGNTALAWAAQQNQLGALRRLIHFGANLNSINDANQTPLDLALQANAHDDVCNAIVAAGGKSFDSLQQQDQQDQQDQKDQKDQQEIASVSSTNTADEVVNAPDAVEFDDDDDDDDDNNDKQ
jgi:ankyrin repeat protein